MPRQQVWARHIVSGETYVLDFESDGQQIVGVAGPIKRRAIWHHRPEDYLAPNQPGDTSWANTQEWNWLTYAEATGQVKECKAQEARKADGQGRFRKFISVMLHGGNDYGIP